MEEKTERIFETAVGRFMSSGYSGVTMDDIARNSGMGKATVYKFFQSKETLFVKCVDFFSARIQSKIEKILADDSLNPVEKLNGILKTLTRLLSHVNASNLDDVRRNCPEGFQKIESVRRRLIFHNISSVLEEGKKNGIFNTDTNTSLVAYIVAGTISYLGNPDILSEFDITADKLLTASLSIILGGCLTEKGRSLMPLK